MGGKSGSTPKAPDYTALANQQSQAAIDLAKYQTEANRANQTTPWGTVSWANDRQFDQAAYDKALSRYQNSQSTASAPTQVWQSMGAGGDNGSDGQWVTQQNSARAPVGQMPNRDDYWSGGDNWTQTTSLSPQQQALFDQQNRLQQGMFGAQNSALGRVNQMYGQGFDQSALPNLNYDPSSAAKNATDLLLQRINPQLDRQQEQLQAQLANQGVTMGSEAYNNAINNFGQTRNDATSQATLQGYGLGMQQQTLANQLRQSALQEQAYLRQLPFNELQALSGGNQVSMPQFGNYAQQQGVQAPNLMGAAQQQYGDQLNSYNAQQANQGGLFGSLGSIAGAGLGFFGGGGLQGAALGANVGGSLGGLFSDRRLKTNIRSLAKGQNGLNIYSYSYVWGGPVHVGYMADEVEKVAPAAVGRRLGFKTVDYSKVG